ncbi:MAG TPA: dihydroneopterin aldolase [Stellaceae bacterium]|nr:dihydroneopterin aldolase [Stellaceae bacterium]
MTDWTLAEALRITPTIERGAVIRRYRIIVRDLILPFHIGIHPRERRQAQRVRIAVELEVSTAHFATETIEDVLNYEFIVAGIKRLAASGHIDLVESLAERIADLSFSDPRVLATRISVEKLDVYGDTAIVGTVIEHSRAGSAP